MKTPELENLTVNGYAIDTKTHNAAIRLQSQMRRLLKPHNKDLRLYLQSARSPQAADNNLCHDVEQTNESYLFTSAEIENFLIENTMLPLEKLVSLASIMRKRLVILFRGHRNAQIPLELSDSCDGYMSQLRANIYALLAILDNDFERLDRERRDFDVPLKNEPQQSIDLSSFDAVAMAANYRGFEVSVLICSELN